MASGPIKSSKHNTTVQIEVEQAWWNPPCNQTETFVSIILKHKTKDIEAKFVYLDQDENPVSNGIPNLNPLKDKDLKHMIFLQFYLPKQDDALIQMISKANLKIAILLYRGKPDEFSSKCYIPVDYQIHDPTMHCCSCSLNQVSFKTNHEKKRTPKKPSLRASFSGSSPETPLSVQPPSNIQSDSGISNSSPMNVNDDNEDLLGENSENLLMEILREEGNSSPPQHIYPDPFAVEASNSDSLQNLLKPPEEQNSNPVMVGSDPMLSSANYDNEEECGSIEVLAVHREDELKIQKDGFSGYSNSTPQLQNFNQIQNYGSASWMPRRQPDYLDDVLDVLSRNVKKDGVVPDGDVPKTHPRNKFQMEKRRKPVQTKMEPALFERIKKMVLYLAPIAMGVGLAYYIGRFI